MVLAMTKRQVFGPFMFFPIMFMYQSNKSRLRVAIAQTLCAAAGLLSAATANAQPTDVFPDGAWRTATPAEAGVDATLLDKARQYALAGGGSGIVTRHGKSVITWGDQARRYDLKSTTKSIGVTALGLAIGDGKLKLADAAAECHPAFAVPPENNAQTGWVNEITLLHLATQTAGFEKPGGYTRLLFRPGTRWHYSDGGPNWLAECVTLAYRQDVRDLMFKRVFTPLGIAAEDLSWRANAYREHAIDGIPRREFGSGISANVEAMARIGYLYLRRGRWKDEQILPAAFVDQASTTVDVVKDVPEHDADRFGDASAHYGLLWWNNTDGTLPGVPRDAYWSWGLYDSLILVIPSLDLVVARAGQSWQRNSDEHYDVLKPFFEPIVSAATSTSANQADGRQHSDTAPYPRSAAIASLHWAPASSIIRRAAGSDNWPITWMDNDELFTAYGDGRGFKPFTNRKLSLGLARVIGGPANFTGVNVRSPSGERTGDGAAGPKASGMLMVDGVLYMWVRNTGNSQLATSADRGQTWRWADWRLTTSFGCPTFLNFGRNYAGARDRYVYVYSHDADSAYEPSDRMVLARVPEENILDRDAYQFFAGMAADGRATWTGDVTKRAAVFESPGRCYRSGITYNAGLKRYVWCQIIPGDDTRFAGGFGVYDAPEPWGPWTTVYHTSRGDVGPGETAHFPTKWMSLDGLTMHLVFSGDDCFSVRRASLELADFGR